MNSFLRVKAFLLFVALGSPVTTFASDANPCAEYENGRSAIWAKFADAEAPNRFNSFLEQKANLAAFDSERVFGPSLVTNFNTSGNLSSLTLYFRQRYVADTVNKSPKLFSILTEQASSIATRLVNEAHEKNAKVVVVCEFSGFETSSHADFRCVNKEMISMMGEFQSLIANAKTCAEKWNNNYDATALQLRASLGSAHAKLVEVRNTNEALKSCVSSWRYMDRGIIISQMKVRADQKYGFDTASSLTTKLPPAGYNENICEYHVRVGAVTIDTAIRRYRPNPQNFDTEWHGKESIFNNKVLMDDSNDSLTRYNNRDVVGECKVELQRCRSGEDASRIGQALLGRGSYR